jgi:hypothetical protein
MTSTDVNTHGESHADYQTSLAYPDLQRVACNHLMIDEVVQWAAKYAAQQYPDVVPGPAYVPACDAECVHNPRKFAARQIMASAARRCAS